MLLVQIWPNDECSSNLFDLTPTYRLNIENAISYYIQNVNKEKKICVLFCGVKDVFTSNILLKIFFFLNLITSFLGKNCLASYNI